MSNAADSRRIPSPLVGPLGNNGRLVELIAEVTGQSPNLVRRKLHEEEQSICANVCKDLHRLGIRPHVWTDKLAEFYEQSDAYLYGLVVWNRRPLKLEMRRWIAEYLARDRPGPLDILASGDGLGFDSLHLAECGHNVTYHEVSNYSVEFARKIFASSGHSVIVLQDRGRIETGAYDVVTCLDVLEHLPDPVGFVGQLAGYLRPGGRLIVHAPFFELSLFSPTHLRSNRRYSGDLARLYLPHGLVPIDGRMFWNPLVLEKTPPNGRSTKTGPLKKTILYFSGLVLRGARRWCGPYCWAARRLAKGDLRWLEGLEPSSEDSGYPKI